jgi:hypothetical protein
MENYNGATIPMESEIQLPHVQDSDMQDIEDRQLLYQLLIGSLMYPMTATWPDLAFTVSMLNKFNAVPTDEHLFAAK